MICRKCGNDNVNIQSVSNVSIKRRGCLGWIMWIILAFCTLGLIIIIPLLTNSKIKNESHSEAICQSCGYKWRI